MAVTPTGASSLARKAAAVVAALLVAPLIVVLSIEASVFGLGYLVTWLGIDSRERFADWLDHPNERAVDRWLEHEFAARWRAGAPFTLADIGLPGTKQACISLPQPNRWVSSVTRDARDKPARELAGRSGRPWWWRERDGETLIAVEYATGTVMAYRIGYGDLPFIGRPPRFTIKQRDGVALCAPEGRLRFVPILGAEPNSFSVETP
jgi:hypothetical protein